MNEEQKKEQPRRTGLEIAVTGMAGRFPGAGNIGAFWENLKTGKESISFFNEQEIEESNVPGEMMANAGYVKSGGGILEDCDSFDGRFFDFSPSESDVMDPQIRIFHECCWEALEDAGYDPYSYDGAIGLYAGASSSITWQGMILFSGKSETLGMESGLLSNRDFLCTRVSYKLNLNGPSVLVHTACSTSLYAVHLACRSLLTKECDMALAGGISIRKFDKSGYLYRENMILSPDGHCRVFDERGKGSIDGNGAGIVVLKKLKDAEADGDHIYAVIKGTAANNDGSGKMGYTAPGIQGEAGVIKAALYLSQVEPESIGYIETHGTGTILGDPIEIEALKDVFPTGDTQYCSLSAVKTNIGHLDTAAGVAGLIKAVLALKHRQIPPSLHFEKANARIDFENSPFYVNTMLQEWQRNNGPLRAGVSSFGIGGTNVHVILEEPHTRGGAFSSSAVAHRSPVSLSSGHVARGLDNHENQSHTPLEGARAACLMLSAKSETALRSAGANLLGFLESNEDVNIADVAYTLQTGRHSFLHKLMLVCADRDEAIRYVTSFLNDAPPARSRKVKTYVSKSEKKFTVFMFPGVGAQYIDMGRGLYRAEPFFQQEMGRCFEIVRTLLGFDLKEIIYPGNANRSYSSGQHPDVGAGLAPARESHHDPDGGQPQGLPLQNALLGDEPGDIHSAAISQPLVFIIEYCLAKLLMHWGIEPDAMIGYSLGEYTAACLSGVFSLEDALKLIVTRSKLIESLPPGGLTPGHVVAPPGVMMSVPLAADALLPLLDDFHNNASGGPLFEKSPTCVGEHLGDDNSKMMEFPVSNFQFGVNGCTRRMPKTFPEGTACLTRSFDNNPKQKFCSNFFKSLAPGRAAGGNTLSIAIDNGESCVVAGAPETIAAFEEFLKKEKRLMCVRLPNSRAIHSAMMTPIAGELEEAVASITLHKPKIPYISNVTGYWISGEDAKDPSYWSRHLTETVKFAAGMDELLKEPGRMCIEVGPGRDLCALIADRLDKEKDHQAVDLIRTAERDMADDYYLLDRLGLLYLYGVQIDWSSFYENENRRRISLPTYPFERQRYMTAGGGRPGMRPGMNPPVAGKPADITGRKPDISDWFYIPSWTRRELPHLSAAQETKKQAWLVFVDACGFAEKLIGRLKKQGQLYISVVKAGEDFRVVNSAGYVLNPRRAGDYELLLNKLKEDGFVPGRILHCWNITGNKSGDRDSHGFEETQYNGFYSLTYLAQALSRGRSYSQTRLDVVSDHIHDVTGAEELNPGKATLLAPVTVISQEYPHIACRGIDIVLPEPGSRQEKKLVENLINELAAAPGNPFIAYRNGYRWEKAFNPVSLNKPGGKIPLLRDKGVYLITGGLGRIGLHLGEYLVKSVNARLILTGRSQFPAPADWETWLASHEEDDPVSTKIRRLRVLTGAGGDILVRSVNAADLEGMKALVAEAEERFGAINGVIHAAGIIGGGIIAPMDRLNGDHLGQQFEAKVRGLLNLKTIFHEKEPDFCIVTSSLSSVLGGLGLTAYAAASFFMDMFIHKHNRTARRPWLSVNWADWVFHKQEGKNAAGSSAADFGISPVEGVETFTRMLWHPGFDQVVVSAGDINARFDTWVRLKPLREEKRSGGAGESGAVSRPALMSDYIAPRNENERKLVGIWQEIFGYDRIGIGDNFFELGGNSLKAITAISRINKELDVNISISEFFSHAAVEELCKLIDNKVRTGYTPLKVVEKKEYYNLSSAQKRLYILYRMNPGGIDYNLFESFRLDKGLDKDQMADVIKRLMKRHESLRTSFSIVGDKPVQIVHDAVEPEILFHPVEEEQAANLRQGIVKPYDLNKAPLFRVSIVEHGNGSFMGLIEMHHIITDGVSQAVLTRDFLTLYAGGELSALRIQYKDFAGWKESSSRHERLKSSEEYWTRLFAGELPVLNLPLDYPRPAVRDFAGAVTGFALNGREMKALKQLSEENNVTLFMLLVSVFSLVLAKLGGQEDIIIGTPTAGREDVELENIIGIFINTLPIRSYPRAEKPYREFLQEVKRDTLASYENQEYQFEDLVEKVAVKRDTGRNPVFDVILNLMNQPGRRADRLDAAEGSSYTHTPAVSRFDMTVTAVDSGEGLYFNFEYCTKLFKPGTIDRFIAYFRAIIPGLAEEPGRKLGEVEIMSPEEKDRVLHLFNDTEGDYARNRTVHGLFEDRVSKNPDRIALTFRDRKLTYKELNDRAEILANYLITKGLGRGTIVGMLLNRSAEIMIVLYGILKSGAAYLPLDPDHPVNRLHYVLKESRTGIVLTNRKAVETPGIEFVDLGDTAVFAAVPGVPAPSRSGEEIAYVTYTSGSTGNPKGVVIRHRNIVNFIEAITRTIPVSAADRMLSLTTVSFDIFGLETLHPLTRGAMVIIGDRQEQIDNRLFSRIMNRERVTLFQVTPSRLKYLLSDRQAAESLALLKHLLIGGEELPVGLLEKVKEVKTGTIYNLYGPTETTIWSSLKEVSADKAVSIGKPVLNTRILILSKSMGLQAVGVTGEIYIGGEGLGAGYLNNGELTAERFLPDPYRLGGTLYRTGDLGRWLPGGPSEATFGGNIECLGRVDYQVKIRGFRIEPGEIENCLMESDFIEDALVVDRLGGDGERYLCAYMVINSDRVKAGMDGTGEAAQVGDAAGDITNKIRRYLANHLPGYMIPSYFVTLDSIPMTPNGKIDRKKLPEPEVGSGAVYEAPRGEIEETLVDIWSDVLNVRKEAIGIDSNFFEIGGNSLKILSVENQIREKLQKEISIIDLFIYTTIRSIAEYFEKGKKELIDLGEDRRDMIKKGKNKLKTKRRPTRR